jgi:hypothetical protein
VDEALTLQPDVGVSVVGLKFFSVLVESQTSYDAGLGFNTSKRKKD